MYFRLKTAIDAYNEEVEHVNSSTNPSQSQDKTKKKEENGKWIEPEVIKVTPSRFKKLDKAYRLFHKYSFIGFATLFLLFNIIYWTWLLSFSKYLHWNQENVNLN